MKCLFWFHYVSLLLYLFPKILAKTPRAIGHRLPLSGLGEVARGDDRTHAAATFAAHRGAEMGGENGKRIFGGRFFGQKTFLVVKFGLMVGVCWCLR